MALAAPLPWSAVPAARAVAAAELDRSPAPTPSVTVPGGYLEFGYTGGVQTWTVPAGVTQAQFSLHGAQGGGIQSAGQGGLGAQVVATLPLTPGETVHVFVGGQGGSITLPCQGPGAPGGFNGGGAGGTNVRGECGGPGGGGGTDLRIGGTDVSDRVLVAGGGGGGGASVCAGGAGGLATGADAPCGGGAGGDQTGQRGSGRFGFGADSTCRGWACGGGGGGWYGGASGGVNDDAVATGGGGGSGFGPSGAFQGEGNAGNGRVQIWYAPAPTLTAIAPAAGPPTGGTAVTLTGTNLVNSDDGRVVQPSVRFGGGRATSVSCTAEGTSCTAVSPAGSGTVDVAVETLFGGVSNALSFTYAVSQPAPPGPGERLGALDEALRDGGRHARALAPLVRAAGELVDAGRPHAACRVLGAFVVLTRAYGAIGLLTEDEGHQYRAEATAVGADLGCR